MTPASNSPTPVSVSGVSDATQISAGFGHSCALRTGGTISCWGYNNYGQLGNGTTGSPSLTPVPVSGVSDATQISAGESHTCALRAGGTISCWGSNGYGQLGNGTTTNSPTPVPVSGFPWTGGADDRQPKHRSFGEQSTCTWMM